MGGVTIAVHHVRVRRLAIEVVVAVVTIAGGIAQTAVQAVRGAIGGHARSDAIEIAIGVAKTLLLQ